MPLRFVYSDVFLNVQTNGKSFLARKRNLFSSEMDGMANIKQNLNLVYAQ